MLVLTGKVVQKISHAIVESLCNRLQMGMRHAFGKPIGLVARVNIGQALLSIRTKDQHKAIAMEALRRAKFKIPGKHKVVVSCKWGFTSMTREEYVIARKNGELITDGATIKTKTSKGLLIGFFKDAIHPPSQEELTRISKLTP